MFMLAVSIALWRNQQQGSSYSGSDVFYAPQQLLTFYIQAQISRIWLAMDAIQKRTIIDDPNVTDSLNSLALRRSVSTLYLFYKYYQGMCFDELKLTIVPKVFFVRSTQFADYQHPFAINCKNAEPLHIQYKTFIYMTSINWNSLDS